MGTGGLDHRLRSGAASDEAERTTPGCLPDAAKDLAMSLLPNLHPDGVEGPARSEVAAPGDWIQHGWTDHALEY